MRPNRRQRIDAATLDKQPHFKSFRNMNQHSINCSDPGSCRPNPFLLDPFQKGCWLLPEDPVVVLDTVRS